MLEAIRAVRVVRGEPRRAEGGEDQVAVEEPLEVRLEGEPFSVIMRTPGSDVDLAVGFLVHEGIVRSADEVRALEQTDDPHVVNVRLSRSRAEVLPDLLSRRRTATTGSSCGLCGRASLESLKVPIRPLGTDVVVHADIIAGLPDILRAAQPTFAATGGLHAAGLFDRDGRLHESAEDIGRHNAVDKLVGRMVMRRRVPLADSILMVSGRSSFEIVQKAYLAGVPVIAAVSAPSTLAIELAEAARITLLGFVREQRFNIYTNPQRVAFRE